MPSSSEFMAKLEQIRVLLDTKLEQVKTKLDTVNASTQQVNSSVQQVNATLASGFGQLVTLGTYTNQALHHNALQNDTIICILEHISRNTCAILTEAHVQTGLQTSMEKSLGAVADLYATVHAEAALAREKMLKLKAQIEECCPPPKPQPACTYERCPAPEPLPKPPSVRPDRPIG